MWYEYLLGILGLIIVILMFYFGFRILRINIVRDRIKEIILSEHHNVEITTHKVNYLYHLEFVKEKQYLIKVIDINPRYEVIITNSDKIVINDDIKNWKRSTKPHFVPGVREFFKLETDIPTVKVIVVYPNCHNITKYINECDAFKVDKYQKVDGVYFIKFPELGDFLKKH